MHTFIQHTFIFLLWHTTIQDIKVTCAKYYKYAVSLASPACVNDVDYSPSRHNLSRHRRNHGQPAVVSHKPAVRACGYGLGLYGSLPCEISTCSTILAFVIHSTCICICQYWCKSPHVVVVKPIVIFNNVCYDFTLPACLRIEYRQWKLFYAWCCALRVNLCFCIVSCILMSLLAQQEGIHPVKSHAQQLP